MRGRLVFVDEHRGDRRGDRVGPAYGRSDGGLDVGERGGEEERAEAERAEAGGEGEKRLPRQKNPPRRERTALLLPEPQRERDGKECHAASECHEKRRQAVRDESLVEKQPRRPEERGRDRVGDAGKRYRDLIPFLAPAEQSRSGESRQRPRRRRASEGRAEDEMRRYRDGDRIRACDSRAARDAELLHGEKQKNVADNVVA